MSSILKISEACSIALHSMIYIYQHQGLPISSKEIVQNIKVSENHLLKVLQRLVKDGLLISSKGPRGGFMLGRKAGDISFLDIYEAIEGKLKDGGCLFAHPNCNNKKCIMGDLITSTNQQFSDYFKHKKLSDFNPNNEGE